MLYLMGCVEEKGSEERLTYPFASAESTFLLMVSRSCSMGPAAVTVKTGMGRAAWTSVLSVRTTSSTVKCSLFGVPSMMKRVKPLDAMEGVLSAYMRVKKSVEARNAGVDTLHLSQRDMHTCVVGRYIPYSTSWWRPRSAAPPGGRTAVPWRKTRTGHTIGMYPFEASEPSGRKSYL
jgi:hypothetical protein